ncbi:MAG: hypothetical protein O3A14_08225, partial [Cyanobacteria bacterium]|nr:hypothetical protein [Cyanobacteriota bacterium]
MNQERLPLINLFFDLKKAGIKLTIEDYELFIKSLQAGFGISSSQELFHLCGTLWIKNDYEFEILKQLFLKHMDDLVKEESHISIRKYQHSIPI